MKRIMFVCTGNTCRSAMAECILKDLVKKSGSEGIRVSSAGLCVTETTMNPLAGKALNEIGIKPGRFVPKNADLKTLGRQNAVICMTKSHKNALTGFSNVYTVDELTGLGDIPDPYGKDERAYSQTAEVLLNACRILLKLIKED